MDMAILHHVVVDHTGMVLVMVIAPRVDQSIQIRWTFPLL